MYLQLIGQLVSHAQAKLPPPRISSMLLTRYHARIPFDDYWVVLDRDRGESIINVTIYAEEAAGLLAEVCTGTSWSQLSEGCSWLFIVHGLLPEGH